MLSSLLMQLPLLGRQEVRWSLKFSLPNFYFMCHISGFNDLTANVIIGIYCFAILNIKYKIEPPNSSIYIWSWYINSASWYVLHGFFASNWFNMYYLINTHIFITWVFLDQSGVKFLLHLIRPNLRYFWFEISKHA